jgi:HK97 family phage major capsid protein
MSWYEIKNAVNDTAEIFIYDFIGEDFWSEGVTAKNFIESLDAVKAKNISLRINSPGGSVFDGWAIYNALKRHPATVTAYVDGIAASIASIIALSADHVHMAANSLFMIHNPSATASGDSEKMRKTADILDKVRENLVSTYRSKTNMTEAELIAAMDAETWYTADEALDLGFVDSIDEAIKMAAHFDMSNMPFNKIPTQVLNTIESEEASNDEEVVAESTPIKESESPVSENTELDVRAMQDELVEVRRLIEANAAPKAPAAAGYMAYRSFGEFVQAFAKGEPAAIELANAASTSADTYAAPGYLGYINKLIESNRPSWNVWSKAALPATGMTVEYAAITANTLAVGEQDPENEALSFGNLTIDNVSAAVKTYGGYTTVSKQAVLRGSVDYVGIVFDALAVAYANATNTAAKAAIAALDFTGKVMDLDGGTAASVIEGLIDGVKYIKANSGLNAEFILCSADAYKYFMKIADSSGRPIVNVNNDGSNTFATANNDLTGSIWGIPVVVDPTLGTGLAYLANSRALQVVEASGSGTRLSAQDVSTLTDTLSLYGFAAITVPFESAIVKLDITA